MTTPVLSENWATLWEALAAASPTTSRSCSATRGSAGATSTSARPGRGGAGTRRGVGLDDKVAQLMYNCPEYLESAYAAFKVRARPR